MRVVIKITVETVRELPIDVDFPCYVKYESHDDTWRDYRLLKRILETGEYVEIKRSEGFSGNPEFSIEHGHVSLAAELSYYYDPNRKYEYQSSSEQEFKKVLAEMLQVLNPVLDLVKS